MRLALRQNLILLIVAWAAAPGRSASAEDHAVEAWIRSEPLRPRVILRTDPYKVQKGAAAGQMGLEVAYPRGPAAEAGLHNGDLVVGVDGRTDMHLEADFLKYIHFDRPQATSVELTVIRNGGKLELTLPIR
jgi:S1-C subfamily serine protease